MGFMNAYKRLDNLCRDINGIGIKGYISDMEAKPDGSVKVKNRKDDYYNLKHYHHIRNQIAHEAFAEESNMCSDTDTAWVEAFHERIMVQTDPLTLYRKATEQAAPGSKPKDISTPQSIRTSEKKTPAGSSEANGHGLGFAIIIIGMVLAFAFFVLYVLCR